MEENIHIYRQVVPVGHSQKPVNKKITPDKKKLPSGTTFPDGNIVKLLR
jgi:hypothetical protein